MYRDTYALQAGNPPRLSSRFGQYRSISLRYGIREGKSCNPARHSAAGRKGAPRAPRGVRAWDRKNHPDSRRATVRRTWFVPFVCSIREGERNNPARHFTASRKGASRARSAFVHGIGKITRIQGGRPRGVLGSPFVCSIRESERNNPARHSAAGRKGASRARSAFMHGIGKITRIQGGRPRGVLSTPCGLRR